MTDHSKTIKLLLEEFDDKAIIDIIKSPDSENYYIIFYQTFDHDLKPIKSPNKGKILSIQKELLLQGLRARFVLSNPVNLDIQTSIQTALLHRTDDIVRNTFVRHSESVPTIWVEPKRNLAKKELDDIQKIVREVCTAIGIRKFDLEFTTNANLPTPTAILLRLRLISPARPSAIETALVEAGFTIPNANWLRRSLDKLRKAEVVTRISETGEYALTLSGLQRMGSRKDRSSPDVRRALALSKRTS